MYKTTYGQLLQYYVTQYKSTEKLVKLSDEDEDKYIYAGKTGHFFNLMSFMLEWQIVGIRQSRVLPRKKKKRLARLYKMKYDKINKQIDLMED